MTETCCIWEKCILWYCWAKSWNGINKHPAGNVGWEKTALYLSIELNFNQTKLLKLHCSTLDSSSLLLYLYQKFILKRLSTTCWDNGIEIVSQTNPHYKYWTNLYIIWICIKADNLKWNYEWVMIFFLIQLFKVGEYLSFKSTKQQTIMNDLWILHIFFYLWA